MLILKVLAETAELEWATSPYDDLFVCLLPSVIISENGCKQRIFISETLYL